MDEMKELGLVIGSLQRDAILVKNNPKPSKLTLS